MERLAVTERVNIDSQSALNPCEECLIDVTIVRCGFSEVAQQPQKEMRESI